MLKRRQLPQPHHCPQGVEWETTCCWAANVEVTSVADCTRTILPSSISLKQAHTADSYHLFCLLLRFHCREGRWKGFIMQPQSDPLLHSVQATIGHVRAVQVDPKPLLGWGPPCNTRTTGRAVEEHPQPCTTLSTSNCSRATWRPHWEVVVGKDHHGQKMRQPGLVGGNSAYSKGVGAGWPFRSLPIQVILWF